MEFYQYNLLGTTGYLKVLRDDKYFYSLYTCIGQGKSSVIVKNNDGRRRKIQIGTWGSTVRHSKGLI